MTKWNIQLKRGSKDRYLKELSKEYNIATLIFELSGCMGDHGQVIFGTHFLVEFSMVMTDCFQHQ